MISASNFRKVVSGRHGGLSGALLRCALGCAEGPYRLAMRWRNRRYDTGRARIHQAGVPVISVGNLTLGGTGKTPLVEWLARWFRHHGVRVAIVSRGYRATAGARNDEALELAQKLPEVPHLQNPDRVTAAHAAVQVLDAQLILLDDAFQHRRIARDLDIVLVDALEPFGFGHVFPRGTLREPESGLQRADVIALSRADMVSQDRRDEIRQRAQGHATGAIWLEMTHQPRALRSAAGHESPIPSLIDQPVAAFCGIGNPAGFRHTLDACGYRVEAFREFPDHHAFRPADIASLEQWSDALPDVAALVCTDKDLVKIGRERLGHHPLWAVSIELSIVTGQAELEARLLALLAEIAEPGVVVEHREGTD